MSDDNGRVETAGTSETDSTPANDEYGRDESDGVPLDEALRLLANERRRTVLSALSGCRGETLPFDQVVDLVAEREHPPPGPVPHRELVEIDLHHVHLPVLADAGAIAYDPVEATVRYEESELLESLLVAATADEEAKR